jgi:hypothetical protein
MVRCFFKSILLVAMIVGEELQQWLGSDVRYIIEATLDAIK